MKKQINLICRSNLFCQINIWPFRGTSSVRVHWNISFAWAYKFWSPISLNTSCSSRRASGITLPIRRNLRVMQHYWEEENGFWHLQKDLQALFEGVRQRVHFCTCFLCLKWNLMARFKNVVHAHILHIEWNADSLVFHVVKSKGE